ncbi:hypothetical protein yc1106_01468 [Curvularia clavata]|uniref:Ankyrin n=1 Tax=Curvularia clavata TaxID=95742 RepID=A0A9Q8Z3J6_CURCL|nr:hypothetical protein yc1106_01468 [Curvularia clavata]
MERDRNMEEVSESEPHVSTPATMEAETQSERSVHTPDSFQPLFSDYKEFYKAIVRGEIETVKSMLDAGANIERKEGGDGATPLVLAIYKRRVDMVKFLLERGANVNTTVSFSPPLFHANAAGEDAPRILQLLLDHGANIEEIEPSSSLNVLHVAAVHGDIYAADFLISKGLDIHRKCEHGKTPFLLAAEKGQTMMVKLLLAKGADLHTRSGNGATALMWAAHTGQVETVKFLLEKGMNLEDRDEDGLTALSVASRAGHKEIVEMLLEKGADINVISTEPRETTPAMWAAIYGHDQVLKVLIDHEADLSILSDDNELNILEIALRRGHAKCAKMLLEAIGGPDHPTNSAALQIALTKCMAETRPVVNTISSLMPHINFDGASSGKWGWIKWVLDHGGELIRPRATLNLLHFALLEDEVGALAELLRLGVDPNTTVFDGDTPLHAAVGRDNIKQLQLLLDSGADPARPSQDPDHLSITPLHYAAIRLDGDEKKDTSIIDALLASGRCKILYGDSLDTTVFAYVMNKFERWENKLADKIVIRMIECIPDVNEERSGEGATLMHAAVLSRNHELVDLLLQKGADMNSRDKYGFTPFIIACPTPPEDFDFIISRGADAFAVDRLGRSTLYHAAAHGSMESVRYLLDLGAASDEKNNSLSIETTEHRGWTPLIAAITKKHEDIALYLLERGASATHYTNDKKRTALHYASLYSMHKLVDKILSDPTASEIINSPDEKGWTPLSLACLAPSPTVVPQLLSHGAEINTRHPFTSDTPLHTAFKRPFSFGPRDARCGDPALLLLKHPSIDLTIRDAQSRTLLHFAAEFHNFPAAELLLSKGASPNDVDASGKTPLALCSRPDTVEALIQAGADVNHAEPNGWTPVHHAVRRCWVAAYAVLVEHGADVEARTADDGMSAKERMERMGGEKAWAGREPDFIAEDMEREKRREKMMSDML